MNIIAVDDEDSALWVLEKSIKYVVPDAEVFGFRSAKEAIDHARHSKVDIAFLDIEMDEMDGLSLAKALKDISGETNIIFVTAYAQYATNAFKVRASGYVMKPINAAHVSKELENLRNPVNTPDKGVRIQCFGNFEVFVDGRPVAFHRSKSKEAFAYLVDRKGAGVGNKELAGILWEDSAYTRTIQSHLRTILAEMKKSLQVAGAENIIVKQYNSHAIDISMVNCDYFLFVAGHMKGINAYRGEYMSNYSWAEFTLGMLDQTVKLQK